MSTDIFDFRGTIVWKDTCGLNYGCVVLDNPPIKGLGYFFLDRTLHPQQRWLAKRFIRGVRVEGRAQIAEGSKPGCTILWMVPEGGGLSNVYKPLSRSERAAEWLEYLLWLYLTRNTRAETRKKATDLFHNQAVAAS